MRCRVLAASILLLTPAGIHGQASSSRSGPTATRGVRRLPSGRPDLSGYWSNNTATPLQRPPEFGGREFLTEQEAKAIEFGAVRDDDARVKGGPGGGRAGPGGVGDYNAVFFEDGKWVLPTRRTSIITDPKDGKIPALTPAAQRDWDAAEEYRKLHPADGPENLTTYERCITGVSIGPPMLPAFYNNNYQFVQSGDHLMIVAEMVHDVRIIPLTGGLHEDIPQWMGDSRGHWEGDTLVVETTDFNGRRGWLGLSGTNTGGAKRPDRKLKVTERFTRTRPDELLYQFTVDDPATYTKPWSGEIPMRAVSGPVYEYACHEGNYSMPLILSSARAKEQEAAKKDGK